MSATVKEVNLWDLISLIRFTTYLLNLPEEEYAKQIQQTNFLCIYLIRKHIVKGSIFRWPYMNSVQIQAEIPNISNSNYIHLTVHCSSELEMWSLEIKSLNYVYITIQKFNCKL